MRNVALLVALMSLPAAGIAKVPQPVAATNAERETGFKDLGECQEALERTRKTGQIGAGPTSGLAGSLFNQAQGNISRCEMVHGEAVVVVYPRGHSSSD